MRIPIPLIVVFVALLAGSAGAVAYFYMGSDSESSEVSTPVSQPQNASSGGLVGQLRPDYTHGSVDGSFISASDFDGQVVLVNFWATWCAPCREEMPMLMDIRDRYSPQGFEVVGVAIDDVAAAGEFLAELGVQYPNVVGSIDVMETLGLYGNAAGTLPYTVLIDRDGIIRWRLMGALKEPALIAEIEGLLDEI